MSYADRRVTPLWLSHHYPEDYDRCVRIGRSHVCRRCLALYPLAIVVMAIGLVAGPDTTNDGPLVPAALVLLPLPAVVEFVLEHVGRLRYQPVRQVLLTLPLAVGLGLGLARYLRRPGDLWFWGAVLAYGLVCGLAALSGRRQASGAGVPSDDG